MSQETIFCYILIQPKNKSMELNTKEIDDNTKEKTTRTKKITARYRYIRTCNR
jgi:hypothetical protein